MIPFYYYYYYYKYKPIRLDHPISIYVPRQPISTVLESFEICFVYLVFFLINYFILNHYKTVHLAINYLTVSFSFRFHIEGGALYVSKKHTVQINLLTKSLFGLD